MPFTKFNSKHSGRNKQCGGEELVQKYTENSTEYQMQVVVIPEGELCLESIYGSAEPCLENISG